MIWEAFGDVDVYAEPFFGSGAVLLGRPGGAPPKGREVVCDLDCLLANFWNALRYDADGVAREADWPTIHQHLTARHKWLIEWSRENAERVNADPTFYDVRAAGWWVWGASNWIGAGWCSNRPTRKPGPIPALGNQPGDGGVMVTRPDDKRPALHPSGGRHGVQAGVDSMPAMQATGAGRGIQASQSRPQDDEWVPGERLKPWFRALQARLFKVVVLNRDWSSAVTPTVLCQTASRKLTTAVFLDPPYSPTQRQAGIYRMDDDGEAAAASWAWAVEHGERIRVAYACMEGDVEVPAGWAVETLQFGGFNGKAGRGEDRVRDMVVFSPACVGQGKLF